MSELNKEDELCQMGDHAEFLLGNDIFNLTINQLVEQAFQAFCNSKDGEQEKRERTYHHYRALVEIVSTLQQRVAIRDEINSKAGDNNQEEE